jgi:hypothetical protein
MMMNADPSMQQNDSILDTSGDDLNRIEPSTSNIDNPAYPSNSEQKVTEPLRLEYSPKRIGILQNGRSVTKKRRVCIRPVPQWINEPEQEHPDHHYSDRAGLWYSARELSECRREAKQLCQNSDIELIHAAYSLCASPTTSSLVIQTKVQQRLLRKSKDFGRQRGLERLSSQSHGLSRNLQILHAKTEFFIAQASQFVSTSTCAGTKRDDAELSKIYAQASMPAVRFARFLGETDALFVRNHRDHSVLVEDAAATVVNNLDLV